jgi:hypothetical protein
MLSYYKYREFQIKNPEGGSLPVIDKTKNKTPDFGRGFVLISLFLLSRGMTRLNC